MAPRQNTRVLLAGLTGAFLILTGIAVYALYYIMTKSLPDTEGSTSISGLSDEVSVIRDPAGIPHILADSQYDAYVAAGYVHAQDRLWQMDMLRRYGMGRLAEVLGPEAVPVDRLMRTIGIHHLADSLYFSVSDQTRNLLNAYSTGVNAGIRQMEGRYPLEFDLLRYTPEEWTPAHSLIITRLMGWELALSWWVDLTLGALVDTLGEEQARELFPTYPDDAPVILPPDYRPVGIAGEDMRNALVAAQRLTGTTGSAIGSNSWVVTRDRSLRGHALLANDPHLLHMQPARWYIMHLHAPGLNVAGVGIPGTPGIVIGNNEHIAWGLTNVMAD
ncbi:MAG: penicillin acylase family protein, partial [Bacteroidetes bacterium]|nr:penicillin acylase family protein [Bacteroidota bacterium]